MEGTRLTIVKVPSQPDAYEFSIRTPVTPPRWKDFEQVWCQRITLYRTTVHHIESRYIALHYICCVPMRNVLHPIYWSIVFD